MTSTKSLVPVSEACNALIKTDVLGRAKRTGQQREQILDDYERSGISGREFSALCGVKYQTFATWVQKRKRERGQYPKPNPQDKAMSKVRWLEASVQRGSALSGSGLLLHLPGSVRAEIVNEQQAHLAAALVRALEKPC